MKEGRDRAHLLAGPDDDAVEQMISSAVEESATGKGDGLERAGVVASLVDNGIEYFDRDDVMIGRHRLDGGKKYSVDWTESSVGRRGCWVVYQLQSGSQVRRIAHTRTL